MKKQAGGLFSSIIVVIIGILAIKLLLKSVAFILNILGFLIVAAGIAGIIYFLTKMLRK